MAAAPGGSCSPPSPIGSTVRTAVPATIGATVGTATAGPAVRAAISPTVLYAGGSFGSAVGKSFTLGHASAPIEGRQCPTGRLPSIRPLFGRPPR